MIFHCISANFVTEKYEKFLTLAELRRVVALQPHHFVYFFKIIHPHHTCIRITIRVLHIRSESYSRRTNTQREDSFA